MGPSFIFLGELLRLLRYDLTLLTKFYCFLVLVLLTIHLYYLSLVS